MLCKKIKTLVVTISGQTSQHKVESLLTTLMKWTKGFLHNEIYQSNRSRMM